MNWSVVIVFACFNRISEDGTPVPKYVKIDAYHELHCMICILLYFIDCICWFI
jgi:hypothetical protein